MTYAGNRKFSRNNDTLLQQNNATLLREMDAMANPDSLLFEQEQIQDSTLNSHSLNCSGSDAYDSEYQQVTKRNKNTSDAEDSDYQPESEADNYKYSYDSPSEYAAEIGTLPDRGYHSDSDSDYELETMEEALISEENNQCAESPRISIPYVGTGATIQEIVSCCVFVSAACAMKHNKQCLREIGGSVCASPMDEKSLGVTLRTRPTPSPNRNLDVNLCYLRHSFRQYDVLLPSIRAKTRCVVSEVPVPTMEDMMFQIILLRFTGRVFRYTQYQRFYNENYTSDQHLFGGLPHRRECGFF
jgi:hypothetical protein